MVNRLNLDFGLGLFGLWSLNLEFCSELESRSYSSLQVRTMNDSSPIKPRPFAIYHLPLTTFSSSSGAPAIAVDDRPRLDNLRQRHKLQ